jgi:hypothetical protein
MPRQKIQPIKVGFFVLSLPRDLESQPRGWLFGFYGGECGLLLLTIIKISCIFFSYSSINTRRDTNEP